MFEVVPNPNKKPRVIQPVEYEVKAVRKRIATWDTETDPFKIGRVVSPFCCGIYFPDTEEYYDFWGDDCIDQFFAFLDANYAEEELLIYAHNFGNFDGYFMVDHFDAGMSPFIINGRLVKVTAHGHEFRDSYAAIPVAMAENKKDEIDYDLFEREVREENKVEIRAYLKSDCVYLGGMICTWLNEFGNKLTMASVALPALNEFHGFEKITAKQDDFLRPYYFGGRTECFEVGILEDNWKIYDVNSMYPDVMANCFHPVSQTPIFQKNITDKTHFAHIRATSYGALPVREKNGLSFPTGTQDFYACIHEIRAAQECGLLEIKEVYSSFYFEIESKFDEFVNFFYDRRMEAKAAGDKLYVIFWKLVLNSSYGKFAQDPRKYMDYLFNPATIPQPYFCHECQIKIETGGFANCDLCNTGETSPDGWREDTIRDGKIIFAKPRRIKGNQGFFNVAIAASITSAARAKLLRGLSRADRPIYCDTDSIICRGFRNDTGGSDVGFDIDPNRLGAWKLEAEGNKAAIAGKKLYAVFNDGEEIKRASKGVRLTASQIERVAGGEVIEYANPVPKFNLRSPMFRNDVPAHGGSASFVTRTVRVTGVGSGWEDEDGER